MRIVFGLLREIGNGCDVGALSGEPQRDDLNRMNVIRFGTHFNFGDAGNHLWHAYGDKQMIWTGEAFAKNVGTANVRAERRGDEQNYRER